MQNSSRRMLSSLAILLLAVVGSLADDPAAKAGADKKQSEPPLYTSGTRELKLPIFIPPENRKKCKGILVFVSADEGMSWTMVAAVPPMPLITVPYTAPADGVYAVALVTIDNDDAMDHFDFASLKLVYRIEVKLIPAIASGNSSGNPKTAPPRRSACPSTSPGREA